MVDGWWWATRFSKRANKNIHTALLWNFNTRIQETQIHKYLHTRKNTHTSKMKCFLISRICACVRTFWLNMWGNRPAVIYMLYVLCSMCYIYWEWSSDEIQQARKHRYIVAGWQKNWHTHKYTPFYIYTRTHAHCRPHHMSMTSSFFCLYIHFV